MAELMRPQRERLGAGAGGLDDLFGAAPGVGLVTVSHGLHTEQLPVANATVGEIRRRYADRFDIDPQSQARIDGRPVRDDETVQTGQHIMFMRHAGEKGNAAGTLA
jgi:hypothetical protein